MSRFYFGSIPCFRGKTGKHHRPGTDTVTLPHFVHGDLLPCCQSFNLKIRLIRIFDGWQYQIFILILHVWRSSSSLTPLIWSISMWLKTHNPTGQSHDTANTEEFCIFQRSRHCCSRRHTTWSHRYHPLAQCHPLSDIQKSHRKRLRLRPLQKKIAMKTKTK